MHVFASPDVKRFMDECVLCGACLEGCPVFLEPNFELISKGPESVIKKVMDVLKGGSTSEEAYKMAYGCSLGCTNRCMPACPHGLELRLVFMAAQHRIRAEGEGLPPLSYHHMPGHRYGFGHVFGDLQMKGSEKPWLKEVPPYPEAVDVVLFISCISHGFPHLVLEAMDILKKMNVNFVTLGARDICCGAGTFFMLSDMEEASKVSHKYISTMARFGAKKVISICCNCAFWGSTVLPTLFSIPFESFDITEFLAGNLDKLRFTKHLKKVVTVHDDCIQRLRGRLDVVRKLLQAIPGITLAEMEHNKENHLCCGDMTNTNFPGSSEARIFDRLDEAKATGANIMTTTCQACQLVFCGYEKQYPFEIKNIITLLAEAMGIHHEDKLKKYLLTGDPDKVLDNARDYVESSDLSLLEFKNVLPGYFNRLCANRGGSQEGSGVRKAITFHSQ